MPATGEGSLSVQATPLPSCSLLLRGASGECIAALRWVTRGELLTLSESLCNAQSERFRNRNPCVQGPEGLVVSVEGMCLERIGGMCSPGGRGGGGKLATPTTALGSEVKWPAAGCCGCQGQKATATWCVPSGSSSGWKPGVGKAVDECGENFLEKTVGTAVYGGEEDTQFTLGIQQDLSTKHRRDRGLLKGNHRGII